MMKRMVTGFALFALSIASAESYRVTLVQPIVLNSNALRAGDYRLDLQDGKVVMTNGKQKIAIPVRVENAAHKYASTNIVYAVENGKSTIHEIQIRGTSTKLLFDPQAPAEVRSGGN